MVFHTRERDDGDLELVLDDEGITRLEDGLTELRHMQPGEAVLEDDAGDFRLRRASDEDRP